MAMGPDSTISYQQTELQPRHVEKYSQKYRNHGRNSIPVLEPDKEIRLKDTKRVDKVLDVSDISIFCYLVPLNDSIYSVLGCSDFRGDGT